MNESHGRKASARGLSSPPHGTITKGRPGTHLVVRRNGKTVAPGRFVDRRGPAGRGSRAFLQPLQPPQPRQDRGRGIDR